MYIYSILIWYILFVGYVDTGQIVVNSVLCSKILVI
jgi:hypothetical protein